MTEIDFLPDRQAITDTISRTIDRQAEDESVLLIVAYWGQGAEEVLQGGKTFKIICNLADGGTNPRAIESILRRKGIRVDLHDMPNLHAKVVIGSSGAVVSSSNMSDNGLQILSDSGNLEAGMYVGRGEIEYDRIKSWGWQCWKDSTEITQTMLDQALASYQERVNASDLKKSVKGDASAPGIPGSPKYSFTELDLFLPERKSNPSNQVRTASKLLKRSHSAMLSGDINKRQAFITAYVANLMWTHAGHSIDWKKGTFLHPSDVVKRWRDLNFADDHVYELLKWISQDDNLRVSIRECANDILAGDWERYVGTDLL